MRSKSTNYRPLFAVKLRTLLVVASAFSVYGCAPQSSPSPLAPRTVLPIVPPDFVDIAAISPTRGTRLALGANPTFDLTVQYVLTLVDGLHQNRPLQDAGQQTSTNVNRGTGQINLSTTLRITNATGSVNLSADLFTDTAAPISSSEKVIYAVFPAAP
jgi:hypothetical protein